MLFRSIREALLRAVVRPYLERRTDGFVTGNVWTGGFVSGNVWVGGFPGDDDVVNLDPEEYGRSGDDNS